MKKIHHPFMTAMIIIQMLLIIIGIGFSYQKQKTTEEDMKCFQQNLHQFEDNIKNNEQKIKFVLTEVKKQDKVNTLQAKLNMQFTDNITYLVKNK